MAARLRAQLAALTADLSANKVSLSSTQTTLSSTQSTVTLTSSGLTDVSSNLYRVAQFDASRNATLQNVKSMLTNKKIYENKYTMPYGLGPYQVDAIPMLIKDKFQNPLFSLNQTTDVSGGEPIAANGYQTTSVYDTPACPQVVVFVPSKRTTPEFTPIFRKIDATTSVGPGSFTLSLEDFGLHYGSEQIIGTSVNLDASGKRIWERINDFKTSCGSSSAPSIAARSAQLQLILNHPDYSTLQNSVRYPFKVWDVQSNSTDWIFENLNQLTSDISSNGLAVPLQNVVSIGTYFTNVTKSSWEDTKDINGNATLVNVTGNVNAVNGKLGVLLYYEGAGGSPSANGSFYFPALCASLGYIVVCTSSNPLMSSFQKLGLKKTLSALLSDSTTTPTVTSYNRADPNSQYYISHTGLYGTGRPDYAAGTPFNKGSYNIGNIFCYPKSPENGKMNERFMYQIKCILSRLGLLSIIDDSNVVVAGLSAGGNGLATAHRLISENITANQGKALQFTLNDLAGSPTATKPFIFKAKALLNWQTVLFDYTFAGKNMETNRRLLDINNINACSISNLVIPMITITGDTDFWYPNPFRNTWYNAKYQTIYQNTRKAELKESSSSNAPGSTASQIGGILSQCAVFYKAASNHSVNESPYDPSTTTDGYTTGTFMAAMGKEMLRGWELDQYISFPATEDVYASGIKSELSYTQLEDMKVATAIQLITHRFLGKEYPVPVSAFNSIGMKYDIDPTNLEITTESQYQRIGPVSELSYDASLNLTINAPSVVLTNRTVDSNSTIVEGQSVALSVDASKNLVTNANSISFSSKKIYEDRYTLPTPTGPYNVDCIPTQLKDQFLMPKFGANKTGDNAYYNGVTSVGASGENITISYTNNLHTDNLYNTYVAPELDVFVPSNRTSFETSPMFKDGVDGSGTVPCAGTFASSLEDALLLANYSNSVTGSTSLDTTVTTFKTAVQDKTTTQSDRTTKLNNIYNHNDYKSLKANMKYPFKVWNTKVVTDNTDGKRKFSYSDLNQVKSDISNNGASIPMLTSIGGGNYVTTKVSDSEWPVDGSGIPTSLLPVASNQNAISSKMGLLLLFNGTGSNSTATSTNSHFAYNLASYGYVTVACHGSPLNGSVHRFEGPKTICKALADRNTDASGMPFISYDTSNNLLDSSAGCYWRSDNLARNTYFVPSSSLYNNVDGVVQTTDKGYEVNRLNVKTMISTPAAKKVYQRYFYQIKCVLDKLGLLQYINLDNVLIAGLSGGGFAPIAFHQLLIESPTTTPSLTQPGRTISGGVSTVYVCNNVNGTDSTIYPKLGKVKAMFNLQANVGNDLSLVPDCAYNPNLSYTNNGLSAPVKKLLVPMITITSDFDTTSSASATSATPMRDNFYNHQAQIVYQLTQKAIETNGAYSENNAILALAKSIVLYRPSAQHTPAAGPLASGDGEYDAAYAGNSFANWIGGWELPQYVQFPSIGRTIDNIGSELAYQQEEDIKTTIASTLIAHRFLGNDYPIPQVALDNLGLRYDIGPLSCDVNTDFEFMKVGPKTQISYDNSYNLQITAPGLTLTSISSAPPTTIDYVNLTPVGQATIKVDASNNIVTNTTGIVLYDASGNATWKLVVSPSGAVSAVPYP